jgi:hypothetical protein
MIKPRILFTFGTLYEPQIISAMLGHEPVNFLATLEDYAVFKGTKDDLSREIKTDIKQKRDLDTFVFLFAKKVDRTLHSHISGKAYYVTVHEELIIDWWERYPKWYRKDDVEIQNNTGEKFQAIVYVTDGIGKLLDNFDRVQGDVVSYVQRAKELRSKVKTIFTGI